MSEWISVSERRPDKEGRYLVMVDDVEDTGWDDSIPWIAFYNCPKKFTDSWDSCDIVDDGGVVTHWMPLPDPPKQ